MSSFPALHGRRSGTLDIERDRLTFTGDDDPNHTFVLSPHRVEISISGQNSLHYYLKDPHQPENEICIQDLRALDVLAQFGNKKAFEIRQISRKKKTIRNLAIGSPFVLAILLILAIPFALSFVPLSWFNQVITYEQEQRLGEFLFQTVEEEFNIVDNHPAKPHLEELVALLQKSSPELASFEFQIHVAQNDDLNAFALPGGIIVVNEGLLRKAKSVESVLGVLAHEMAHVERRHSVKSMAGHVGSLAGVIALSFFVGSDAAIVISKAGDFLSLKYSRSDESEADQQGFRFLTNAGVPASGMIQFFEQLEVEEKMPSSLSFLSTHPLSGDRVQALKRLEEQNPAPKAIELPVTLEELRH